MGCIYNRGSKKDPIWWIKWRENGKTRYKRVGDDRDVAKRVLRKIEGDIVSGKAGLLDESAPDPTAVLFSAAAAPWIENRKKTHRAGGTDAGRMKNHLIKFFGKKPLNTIGVRDLKDFIEAKRKKIAPATIRYCLLLLSRMFNDLIDDGLDLTNPVSRLGRATRRKIGPAHDPRTTPYLRSKNDIRAVYLALPASPSPLRIAFAFGVFGGLRTGEVQAIERGDVDIDRRLVHVRRSAKGPLKDDDSRFVPINDALLPILKEWLLRCPHPTLLVPPEGRGTKGAHGQIIAIGTLHKYLRKAFEACDLQPITWYQATRHTYASHFVMDGGQIERLAQILGHATSHVTERYCHLLPDRFGEREYRAVTVDLTPPEVVPLTTKKSAGTG